MRMSNRQQGKTDLARRIGAISDKARYPEVAAALGLDTELCDEAPCCGGFLLKSCHDGKGWYCGDCGEKGGMIKLVMLKRGETLNQAVAFLETTCIGRRDDRTPDLFSAATNGECA